jgi:hypothetical protein
VDSGLRKSLWSLVSPKSPAQASLCSFPDCIASVSISTAEYLSYGIFSNLFPLTLDPLPRPFQLSDLPQSCITLLFPLAIFRISLLPASTVA